MMHDLHEHLTQSIAERFKKRRVLTWYDPRRQFTAFVAELAGGNVPDKCQIDSVGVGGTSTSLCVMQDSFFEVKFVTESRVAGDLPDPLLIYIPGKERHDDSAILMELEAGGDRWEPQLKREARKVLKKRFGDGQIDQMLGSQKVTYQDIVGLLEGGGDEHVSGSLLEVIYGNPKGSNAGLLTAWLVRQNKDAEVTEKGARSELFQLIQSRLGFELQEDTQLEDARRKVSRYVLLGEFRNDLLVDPPESLNMVNQPVAKHLELALEIAKALRETHLSYVNIADDIQQELRLDSLGIAPENLGRIDTFRFEEQVLLEHVGNLIVDGKFSKAFEVVKQRRHSFWARYQLERQEQWQAHGLAAQLGLTIGEVTKQLPDSKKAVVHWIKGYVAENGWHRADRMHRQLESTLSAMTATIASEKVVHRVRKDYELLVDKMTSGFVSAFKDSGWLIPEVLQQTEIYSKQVYNPSDIVCFLLVDALRYEMGVELMSLLENAEKLSIQPAVAAIPTITPMGMAALMPGAEESYSVVECGKDIGAKINASVAGSLNDRRKIWKGKVPGVVDLELDKVLSHSNSQLQKRIAGSPLVLVRSVEIDSMGEGGNTFLARQVMDTAINNVARAIKRLAGMGISKFVVAADHGHLFIHQRDESERIEKPGGEQVSLHRRCWAGRGGSTPPSTVRISASQLGYDSDLDFVFPTNNSVFKAGGDLTFYHGGLSLQELLVPVLSIWMPAETKSPSADVNVILTKLPEIIVNRIVTFGLTIEASLFTVDNLMVRPVLLSNGQHVGHVGIVLDAEHDPLIQGVLMKPGTTCTVGVQLLRDDVDSVEIVVLDPETDRIYTKSKKIPVKLGI